MLLFVISKAIYTHGKQSFIIVIFIIINYFNIFIRILFFSFIFIKLCYRGDHKSGQLGLGALPSSSSSHVNVPCRITLTINNSIHHATHVACGSAHSMCITMSGQVLVWGRGESY
jgi:hypothetical protein